jgi:F-type H+-transporting ATPase subunit b
MQDLDIISVNIWHIFISLANLVILFLILKKLLFKPVKKIVDKRQKELEAEYCKA